MFYNQVVFEQSLFIVCELDFILTAGWFEFKTHGFTAFSKQCMLSEKGSYRKTFATGFEQFLQL